MDMIRHGYAKDRVRRQPQNFVFIFFQLTDEADYK